MVGTENTRYGWSSEGLTQEPPGSGLYLAGARGDVSGHRCYPNMERERISQLCC